MVAMYYSSQIYDVTLTYKKKNFLRTLQKLMKDSLTNALFNFIKINGKGFMGFLRKGFSRDFQFFQMTYI